MNKEALRKELEDCWDAGYENGNLAKPRKQNREAYITTRLAALDDWDDGNSNQLLKEYFDLMSRSETEQHFDHLLQEHKWNERAKKVISRLDDGQEGKGLPNFLVIKDSDDHYFIWPRNRYEKYVSEAVEVGATPAVKIVVGFNGDEDFLFPKPLPLADGEGEKVGEFQQIFSYECGCGWRGEWDKLISKHGGPSCPKCGIVLSEGQPAQGKE